MTTHPPTPAATTDEIDAISENTDLDGLCAAAYRWGFERRVNPQPREHFDEYRRRHKVIWKQLTDLVAERDALAAQVQAMTAERDEAREQLGTAWRLIETGMEDPSALRPAVEGFLLHARTPAAVPPADQEDERE